MGRICNQRAVDRRSQRDSPSPRRCPSSPPSSLLSLLLRSEGQRGPSERGTLAGVAPVGWLAQRRESAQREPTESSLSPIFGKLSYPERCGERGGEERGWNKISGKALDESVRGSTQMNKGGRAPWRGPKGTDRGEAVRVMLRIINMQITNVRPSSPRQNGGRVECVDGDGIVDVPATARFFLTCCCLGACACEINRSMLTRRLLARARESARRGSSRERGSQRRKTEVRCAIARVWIVYFRVSFTRPRNDVSTSVEG